MNLSFNGSRKQLVNQLVYFDEEKFNFLEQYFPEPGKERARMDQLLASYCSELEKIVAQQEENSIHSSVLIGSRVKLSAFDFLEDETYTIVFPELADPENDRISFLSPIGYQLLLAKTNQTLLLDIPSGIMDVHIKEIAYMNLGDINN